MYWSSILRWLRKRMVSLPLLLGPLNIGVRKSRCSSVGLWFGCIWSVACSSGHLITGQMWRLWTDVEASERVQRRFTSAA